MLLTWSLFKVRSGGTLYLADHQVFCCTWAGNLPLFHSRACAELARTRDSFRTLRLPWNKCSCARVERGTRCTRTRVSFFIFPSIYSQHTHGILLLPIRPFWSSSGTTKFPPALGLAVCPAFHSRTWADPLRGLRALVICSELCYFRGTNAHAREWNAAHALVFHFSFFLLLYIRTRSTRTRVSFFLLYICITRTELCYFRSVRLCAQKWKGEIIFIIK